MLQKLVSLLLSLLSLFFTSLPTAVGRLSGKTEDSAPEFQSVGDYMEYVRQNGAGSMSTELFLNALAPVDLMRRIATGRIFYLKSIVMV